MSHSFISQLMHCVFSTKQRRPMITPELQPRLFQYIGGIARENKIKLLSAGGVDDHVHLLISMPSTISAAKTLQLLKGGSSKWIQETFSEHRLFEWQEGYAHFQSVSAMLKERQIILTDKPSITEKWISKQNFGHF